MVNDEEEFIRYIVAVQGYSLGSLVHDDHLTVREAAKRKLAELES